MMFRFAPATPDLPAFENPGMNRAINVVPLTDLSYGPWKRPSVLSSNAMDARCQGAISGADYSGNLFTFTGDAGKLYRYTGNTFNDVSKAGGYTTVAGYNDRTSRAWQAQQFQNLMIKTNFADPPQKFLLGTDSQFSDLAATAPKAKYMATVQNSLVLGNTSDSFDGAVSLRLWFSPVGNPSDDDWGNVDKQSDFRTLPNGREITGIVGGEFGIIFCRSAVYRMTYAGPPTIFQIDEINPQHGCIAPGSIAYNENRIFYLSEDGMQMMVNGGPNQPIGQDTWDETILAALDSDNIGRVHSAIWEERKLYLLAVPTSTSTNGTPNRVFAYNYNLRTPRWTELEEEADLFNMLSSPGLTLEEVAALYPNANDVPGVTDNPAWKGGKDFLGVFLPDNKLYSVAGQNAGFSLETQELALIDGQKSVLRKLEPVVDCDCVEIEVGVRQGQEATVVYSAKTKPNSITRLCSFRRGAKGRYHRVRVTAPEGWTGTEGGELVGVRAAKFTPAGAR